MNRRGRQITALPATSCIGWTRSVLALAAEVADRTGYNGAWDLGFAADRLRGAADYKNFGPRLRQ